MISIRLLIDNKGAAEQRNLSVLAGESLVDINQRLTSEEQVRWIFQGRTLQTCLPLVITPHTTFHVIFGGQSNILIVDDPPLPMDKSLLAVIYTVFAILLAFAWHRYSTVPDDFDSLAMFLLIAFSIIFPIAILSNR